MFDQLIKKKCAWQEDEDGVWETGCHEMFVFEADGPQENDFRFCPYCGGPLLVVKSKKALG